MTSIVRKATEEDIKGLITQADKSTITFEQRRALIRFLNASTITWVGVIGDRVYGIVGVMQPTIIDDRAYIWFQGTGITDRHQFTLIRQSQIMVKKLLEKFPVIYGHCEVSDVRAHRWVKWLGGTFGEVDGSTIPFQIVRK